MILILSSNSWNMDSEAACRAYCASNQRWIYRIIREVPGGEGFELLPEWTVADLIRDAVEKNLQTSRPLPESVFICRNIRKVRERAFPYLRRIRTEVYSPYLVFPAPASVVFDESLQQPVPILMCPPGIHGTQKASMVLYSDGSTNCLTADEAEKLFSECHPEPINFPDDATAGHDEDQTEDRPE